MAIRKSNLLTVKEVAEYLNIHEQTVYDRVKEGAIPHIRIGGSVRFDLEEVIEFHRQEVQPKIINYQPPIVKIGEGKITKQEDLKKMRKGCSSKPQTGRWNIGSGTILTRVTKKGVIRYYGIYYDAERKIQEKVLKHARNFDEAVIELNSIYENVIRTKHGIEKKQKRIKLGEFIQENKINSCIRGKVVKYFGDKWLDEITELEVLSYVRKRNGSKNNTINNELIALRKTLNLAKRGHYSIDSEIRWGSCFRKQEFRDRVLNDEEEEKLMSELADHLKPIVTCALNTGMRRGEIFSLKWKNIVDGKIVLEARNTKTKKQRRIPINSKLQEIFEILKSRNGFSGFVFTYGRDRLKDIHNGFSKACKRADIDDLHFHDLRRTFATRLMRNGVGIYTISQLLGHASVEMTQRYINWQPEDGSEAVESLVRKTSELRNNSGMDESEQPLLPLVTSVVS